MQNGRFLVFTCVVVCVLVLKAERMEDEYETEILQLCEEIAVLEAEKESVEREVSILHGQYVCSVL